MLMIGDGYFDEEDLKITVIQNPKTGSRPKKSKDSKQEIG